MRNIRKLAIQTDWNDAFAGKSKGNRHLFRVVKLTKHMAKKLGAHVPTAEAGAWLHDTALPSGNDYDYKKNKKIVRDILADLDITQKESESIAECVASHEGTSKPATLEAKIVHDSDVLEKTGMLGIIRHTWKLTNSGKMSPGNITSEDISNILNHLKWRGAKLETPLAKRISRYLTVPVTKTKAKEIISTVANEAVKGVVTEKIAKRVYKSLTKHQRDRLKEQLDQSYLRKF